jgi:hypothetical protein
MGREPRHTTIGEDAEPDMDAVPWFLIILVQSLNKLVLNFTKFKN